jgi:FkbM family methyltransferase
MSYEVGYNCQVKDLSDIYTKYFGENKVTGTFVEIGAYDGYDCSNTWGLAKLGWNGVAVECNPLNYIALAGRYWKMNNVDCVYGAIAGGLGFVNLFMRHSISTTSADVARMYKDAEWFDGTEQLLSVPCVTLEFLLEHKRVPKNFDLLVIDTEGTEFSILKDFPIKDWMPKMAIIEASENHPILEFRKQADDINGYFEDAGYTKTYSDEINNIYVL